MSSNLPNEQARSVTLRPVGRNNWRAVVKLEVASEQDWVMVKS